MLGIGELGVGLMHEAVDRRHFYDAARNIVENSLYLGATPNEERLRLHRSPSLRRRLVTEVTTAAMQHALATGQDVDDFAELARRGIGVVSGLEYGLTENRTFNLSEDAKPVLNWNFWRHDDDPHVRIKKQKFPYMDRYSIEEDAYAYLDLPYRVPLLERTIVDILIALELFAYSKEMFEKLPRGLRWLSQSPLTRKHVLRQYIEGRMIGAVIFLGPAYLATEFGPKIIGVTASEWAFVILLVLFFLEMGLSTISLPFVWQHRRKAKRNVRKLLMSMVHTYAELRGDGQISTRRLREVAARAADAGVVWPKPLFLMLDDNIARTGRI